MGRKIKILPTEREVVKYTKHFKEEHEAPSEALQRGQNFSVNLRGRETKMPSNL